MGRHSYDYDPGRDADDAERSPDGAPSEPPPLLPAEAGDGTGAESGDWQSAGESVL